MKVNLAKSAGKAQNCLVSSIPQQVAWMGKSLYGSRSPVWGTDAAVQPVTGGTTYQSDLGDRAKPWQCQWRMSLLGGKLKKIKNTQQKRPRLGAPATWNLLPGSELLWVSDEIMKATCRAHSPLLGNSPFPPPVLLCPENRFSKANKNTPCN